MNPALRPSTRKLYSPWVLPAILILGLGLRLLRLNGRPLWYDEAFSILYAEKGLSTIITGTITPVAGAAAEEHPLLYYTALQAWMQALGQRPGAVRALSVLAGVTTIFIVYLLTRRLFGSRAATVAALITALAPFHVYYSQEARMYALLGLAAISTTYFLVRAWTEGGLLNWLGYALTGAATLYTHNLGALFLSGLGVWVLWAWIRGPRWRHLRGLVLSHLLLLLLFAPWLTILPSQFSKVEQAYWVTRPGVTELIQTFLIFHFAYDNQALPAWLLLPALLFALLLPALVLVEGRRLPTEETERFPYPYALLLATAVVPVVLAFLISQIQPVYVVRALLPSALLYYVLVGRVVFFGRMPGVLKVALAGVSLLIVLASLINHYTYEQFPRAPYAEVAESLQGRANAETAIVHSNKLSFLPTHYYDRELNQAFVGDPAGSASNTLALPTQRALGLFASPDLETATAGAETVYFLIFRQALAEFAEAGSEHPHLAWLDRHYTLTREQRFADLLLYEYQR